jgi:hypothetical protein
MEWNEMGTKPNETSWNGMESIKKKKKKSINHVNAVRRDGVGRLAPRSVIATAVLTFVVQ